MNKVLRVLLLAVVVLAMVVPLTVSAQTGRVETMRVSGNIYNGTNGGPAEPVTVRLYRDTGGGDVMIREETFDGKRKWDVTDPWNPVPAAEEWNNTFSAMGNFQFQVSCVQGFYTLWVDSFMEGGAEAVGVAWYQEDKSGGKRVIKKEAGDPGPWTYSWYQPACTTDETPVVKPEETIYLDPQVHKNFVFEYSSVAGPRANAGWMYISGKAFRATGTGGVAGVPVQVDRVPYNESTNTIEVNHPIWQVQWLGTPVTGDKGFWGMGLTRQPGFYRVMALPVHDFAPAAVWFQVFDVYRGGGPDQAYGPGSSWLPWDYMQPNWVYSNLNFRKIAAD